MTRARLAGLAVALAACGGEASKPPKTDGAPKSDASKADAPKTDASPKADAPPMPGLTERFQQAKIDQACISAQSLASAVEMFVVMKNACPETLQALADERIIPRLDADPWGTAYDFTCADGKVTITSRGPDRTAGTEDDLAFGEGATSCAP